MEPRKETTVKLYLSEQELQTLQEMVNAAKEEDPVALKDWNLEYEVQFLCTSAIQKWNERKEKQK